MDAVYNYFLKLSISLACLYLFYTVFLRPLTFYRWNRKFLLIYSVLAIVIPLINIAPEIEATPLSRMEWVQAIPNVQITAPAEITTSTDVINVETGQFSIHRVLGIIIFGGMLIMLTRMVVQLFAFILLKRSASLIINDQFRVYNVNKPILPFSFGNSVFINRKRHSEDEINEILRHELVHVREKHSVDIIWAELFCVINWFNPFAWLLRKAIKQNLEFIADEKVLQSGTDRKQYQYLLLKVTGLASFGMASSFNLSSLQKRIVMMNKVKSARLSAARFLFAIPLLGMTLLAFRNSDGVPADNDLYVYTGIVYDGTGKRLEGINIREKNTGLNAITDKDGHFVIRLPFTAATPLKITPEIVLPGSPLRQAGDMRINLSGKSNNATVNFIQIDQTPDSDIKFNHSSHFESSNAAGFYSAGAQELHSTLESLFQKKFKSDQLTREINRMAEGSDKIIWIVNGQPTALIEWGRAWFDESDLKDVNDFKVMIDGEIVSGEDANKRFNRHDYTSIGASDKIAAFFKYGIYENLFILESEKYQNRKTSK